MTSWCQRQVKEIKAVQSKNKNIIQNDLRSKQNMINTNAINLLYSRYTTAQACELPEVMIKMLEKFIVKSDVAEVAADDQ